MSENKIIIKQEIPEIDLRGILSVATLDTNRVRINHEYNTVPIHDDDLYDVALTVEQATEYLALLKTNERKANGIIETVLSPFTEAKRWLETSRKKHETEANAILSKNKMAQQTITSQLLVINRKEKEIAEQERLAVLEVIRQKQAEEKAEALRLAEKARDLKVLEDAKLVSKEEVLKAEAMSDMQNQNVISIETISQKIEDTKVEIKSYSVTEAGSISTKYNTVPVWECVDIDKLLSGLQYILSEEGKQKCLRDTTPSLNTFVRRMFEANPEEFKDNRTVFGLKLSTKDEMKTTLRK